MFLRIVAFISIFFTSIICHSQIAKQYSVMLSVEIDSSSQSTSLELNWQNDNTATEYKIYRRQKGGDKFHNLLGKVSGAATNFNDPEVQEGILYEYKVEKKFTPDTTKPDELQLGYGYIYGGWNVDLVDTTSRSILLLIDYTLRNNIENKLSEYIEEIEKEGWKTYKKSVPRVEEFNPKAVVSNKNLIRSVYEDDPSLKAVLLVGRVAVPYSGEFAADGHIPEHKGAWPADVYYGDLDDKNWTDSTVISDESSYEWQYNYINDGKFDHNIIPGFADLQVGRVDFYNLPAFEESEVELIKRYFDKNIAYRKGEIKPDNNAIIYNGFQREWAADAWINFSAIYGKDNIAEKRVREELKVNSYEWTYAGASGGFDSIFDAIYTSELNDQPFKTVFASIHGSRNIDWNTENNLLRAAIASQPMCIAVIWGSWPHWVMHGMGIGETIGDVLLKTQNNHTEYKYSSGSTKSRYVHIPLIGDPTLKLRRVESLSSIATIDEIPGGPVSIILLVKDTSNVVGFLFEYKKDDVKVNVRKSVSDVSGINYNDKTDSYGYRFDYSEHPDLKIEADELIIFAIRKVYNNSGSFYKLSRGIKTIIK